MQKSKIEWCDYTINPVKGLCPVACPYCYARRMYKRFHWNEDIREDISVYDQLYKMKAGSKVFVGSTMELFGDWINSLIRSNIFNVIEMYTELTFIFLTKCPQNLPKEFPDNCWVGVSATNQADVDKRLPELCKIDAPVRFVSCEPLLSQIDLRLYLPSWGSAGTTFENPEGLERFDLDGSPVNPINWLIIGQQTPVKAATQPKIEWIQEILVAAHNAGDTPVFMKNNLQPLLTGGWSGWKLRQEFPKEAKKE